MKQTILLVEDNLILQDALKEILTLDGFHVFTASNGIAALATLKVVLPDLIISDISMPEMDGHEFFSAVREQPKWVTIPFIFLTARSNGEGFVKGKSLGAEDYLPKPINRDELVTTVRARLKRVQQLEMARLREAYEASLVMLTNAIEARDRYMPGHVDRVRDYAEAIGEQLNWDKAHLQDLRLGAILHDIGKIYIDEIILRKEAPLSAQEWKIIRSHPEVGVKMLKDIPYLAPAIPVIHYHHERWDGSGYPEGLQGEAIPPEACVVAVADVFDAMINTRIYRNAHSLEDVHQTILEGSGVLFSPQVIEAFDQLWREGAIQEIAKTGELPNLEDQ